MLQAPLDKQVERHSNLLVYLHDWAIGVAVELVFARLSDDPIFESQDKM